MGSEKGFDLAEYRRRLGEQAEAAFAHHQIRESSEGRWVLMERDGRGWQPYYWTEVVILRGGKLLAHGDIDSVIFEAYVHYRDPLNVLAWMGRHPLADSYAVQKASKGTGSELALTTDPDVCRHELHERLEELYRDTAELVAQGEPTRAEDERAEHLRDALEMLARGGGVEEVRRELYDAGEDPESIHRLGEVPSARVFYAHAAIRRLQALLDAATATPGAEVSRG
jgi:hypothetical protein